ncbi:hypothetical protein E2562_027478 [Oryza meyeriana var. granulata]|uniref:Uncharacterized protein n=1 Tax=Oryza meyeriana var. granulata TaxID=110450 RepID=A0A6G1E2I4_9ORYZ|nr:hypothetical protein E2562_027478 [Oryza meyeriana var. granulata]
MAGRHHPICAVGELAGELVGLCHQGGRRGCSFRPSPPERESSSWPAPETARRGRRLGGTLVDAKKKRGEIWSYLVKRIKFWSDM